MCLCISVCRKILCPATKTDKKWLQRSGAGGWGVGAELLAASGKCQHTSLATWRIFWFWGQPCCSPSPFLMPPGCVPGGMLWAGPCPTERVLGVSSKFIFWPRFFPWQRTEAGWGCGRAGSCGRAAVLAGRARGGLLMTEKEGIWGKEPEGFPLTFKIV